MVEPSQARAATHELATALSVLSDRLANLEAYAAAVPKQIQELSDRLEELEHLVHFLIYHGSGSLDSQDTRITVLEQRAQLVPLGLQALDWAPWH